MPDTTPTPQPFRFIDEDDFCLSARLVFNLPAMLSITIEGSDEPQSAHVPVGDLPQVLAGIAEAAGLAPARLVLGTTDQQPATAPADTELRDRVAQALAEYDLPYFSRQRAAEVADAVLSVLPAPTDRATAPLAAGLPLVTGRCPACGTAGLFLGDGGYVTCSLIDCPAPDAASTVLERGKTTPPIDRAAVLREAADAIEAAQHHRDDLVNEALGFLDNNTEQQHHAVHRAGGLLRRLADEAQQPETEAAEGLCGNTIGVGLPDNLYRPCARPAGHPEAYCRDATGDHLFLAAATPAP